MRSIKKLLIANRGEIAVRIIRSAKELGLGTVAVFSEADRKAPHVQLADEAICLGGNKPSASYLDIDKIIKACITTGADAVHPGYGFLSENAVFAKRLAENNIRFVGPTPTAIQIMGDKLTAKEAVIKHNVPTVPGSDGSVSEIEEAKKIAAKIGYPVLVKAAAGGGGKGMRIVNSESELSNALERASSEALTSFGSGEVFIEKYIISPRHIEFQILGDNHGNYIHLFERECSIQRRHQKLIEEAPSCILTEEIRNKMGEVAILAAKSCDYTGAGTVEFILDRDLNYYFLEMNTRLQVEHPVTEMITGIDLVKEQIKIANNEILSIRQEDLYIHGHSIELRVNAEDPLNDFLPDTGEIVEYIRPQGNGIRVDDGVEQGREISIYYDSMIAKLIVHAKTRDEAIKKMIRAIEEYTIVGLSNTLTFGEFVMKHPQFIKGDFGTDFVNLHFAKEKLNSFEHNNIAALTAFSIKNETKKNVPNELLKQTNKWILRM